MDEHGVLGSKGINSISAWKHVNIFQSTSDFPEACRALLDQVLAAGLLKSQSQFVRLLDVGCGCGDQSLYLTSVHKDSIPTALASESEYGSGSAFQATPTSSLPQSRLQHDQIPLIDTYIGITLEPTQAALAKSRVQEAGQKASNQSAEIFCADAANPARWSGDLQASVKGLSTTSQDPNTETWLLALDTIYHFRPSRWPIIQFAHDTLQASFMAFDLVLADDTSFFQRLLLRIVCWALGAPFGNIITQEEYRRLLVKVGYEPSQIEMRDISEHVFGGLSAFLGRRIEEAEPFGLKMGKYRGARVVFNWWAKTGIIRGYVVVARKS